MTDIFEKFAKLREIYPDDIERIEEDEKQVRDLLHKKEFSLRPETQELIRHCREETVQAKLKLLDRRIDEEGRKELWSIVDAREWVLKMISGNFDQEIQMIETTITAELS
jgi:hypothetical protein